MPNMKVVDMAGKEVGEITLSGKYMEIMQFQRFFMHQPGVMSLMKKIKTEI